MRRCSVRAMYLSDSVVAGSTWGAITSVRPLPFICLTRHSIHHVVCLSMPHFNGQSLAKPVRHSFSSNPAQSNPTPTCSETISCDNLQQCQMTFLSPNKELTNLLEKTVIVFLNSASVRSQCKLEKGKQVATVIVVRACITAEHASYSIVCYMAPYVQMSNSWLLGPT